MPVKQYIYCHHARELLEAAKAILSPLTLTWEFGETTQADLEQWGESLDEVLKIRARPFDEMTFKTLDEVWRVFSPLISHRDIPRGGEQQGNMLCIESALYRIDWQLTRY